MNPRKIVIDGMAYNSVDEMPEDVRQKYEQAMKSAGEFGHANVAGAAEDLKNIFADRNSNGTPDIFEEDQAIHLAGGMKFIVDGKSYNSLDELPPDARAKYEQAMGAMDRNRNGMPDFLEGMMNISTQAAQPAVTTTSYPSEKARHASRQPMPVSPTITPDTSNGGMLVLGIGAILFLCAAGAAGIWYFFLR